MAVNTTKVEHKYRPGTAMAAEALADLSFTSADEIVVEMELIDEPDVFVPLAQDADYELTLPTSGSWGTVRALAEHEAGTWFHVRRITPRTQQERFTPFNVSAPAIERLADKSMRIEQEQDGLIDRAIKLPRGESGFELDRAPLRADKVLGFDYAGRPIAVTGMRPDTELYDDGVRTPPIDPDCECGPGDLEEADDGAWDSSFSTIVDEGPWE